MKAWRPLPLPVFLWVTIYKSNYPKTATQLFKNPGHQFRGFYSPKEKHSLAQGETLWKSRKIRISLKGKQSIQTLRINTKKTTLQPRWGMSLLAVN